MNHWVNKAPTAAALMELHVQAMFTHDRDMRIRTINEPWPGEEPAPKFFLGRTIDGSAICRFRHDVPERIAGQLKALVEDEPIVNNEDESKPKHVDAYMNLLRTEHYTSGPCYRIPDPTTPGKQTVRITQENINEYSLTGFEWLITEIDYGQPYVALIHENRVASVCRSVRITEGAHEAGLETLEEFRGRGYAAAVVAGWAVEARKIGVLPLYSTLWENHSSLRVASKLALSYYGVHFTIR
jgi:GNAT superfamily N-acetyltransferase